MSGDRWNHNIHFHPAVLRAVPPGASSALDVGTGDGLLAAELRRALPDVTGIDVDERVLAAAAEEAADVRWVLGDVMTHPFDRTFDVVASIATLHHLGEPRASLTRLRDLVAPGGVLVVVGVADETTLRDRLLSLAGVVQHQVLSRTRNHWEHTAPTVWPPAWSFDEVRAAAQEALPGARWRQHPLWRYSVVWRRP